ncbi:MAG: xanthine dehydrogenase family protein subunit M [Pseudomonadota bacterium]
MRPFSYARAESPAAAVQAAGEGSMYHAGGTTLIDLMKLDVWQPDRLIDISRLDAAPMTGVERDGRRLRIGALTRMADLAADERLRKEAPVLTDSLWLAASAQVRNMARLGGNVLQMTRCSYFRDTSYPKCNKRAPGSGCSAMDGVNRQHAVLGTSDQCIATYAGDWAQALVALDATVDILGKDGPRTMRFAELHRRPDDRPDLETNLRPGDLIVAFTIPDADWPRSTYLKIRDRESYAYALASAAVALRMDGDTVKDVRIGLGGVATVPWRASEAERLLTGGPLDEARAEAAAERAFAGAATREHNEYKVELGRRTLVRALLDTARMEV